MLKTPQIAAAMLMMIANALSRLFMACIQSFLIIVDLEELKIWDIKGLNLTCKSSFACLVKLLYWKMENGQSEICYGSLHHGISILVILILDISVKLVRHERCHIWIKKFFLNYPNCEINYRTANSRH